MEQNGKRLAPSIHITKTVFLNFLFMAVSLHLKIEDIFHSGFCNSNKKLQGCLTTWQKLHTHPPVVPTVKLKLFSSKHILPMLHSNTGANNHLPQLLMFFERQSFQRQQRTNDQHTTWDSPRPEKKTKPTPLGFFSTLLRTGMVISTLFRRFPNKSKALHPPGS